MSLWMGEAKIHELYTAACGLYVCWLTLRIGTVLYNWIPQGTAAILNKLKEWLILVSLRKIRKPRGNFNPSPHMPNLSCSSSAANMMICRYDVKNIDRWRYNFLIE